jgi:hypothetical protein
MTAAFTSAGRFSPLGPRGIRIPFQELGKFRWRENPAIIARDGNSFDPLLDKPKRSFEGGKPCRLFGAKGPPSGLTGISSYNEHFGSYFALSIARKMGRNRPVNPDYFQTETVGYWPK